MIVNELESSLDADPSDYSEPAAEISKSQRKRDADSIRDLGLTLSRLGPGELATVPLPDDVIEALEHLGTIKANGARKRQLGLLAKRLRSTDTVPINEALERINQKARAHSMNLHLVEQWRDRLLGDVADESASDALTLFLRDHVAADRQQLRQLQRQALKEREQGKPPAAARRLFKAIRTILNESDSP
jgi:ribosome-associated protein